MPLRFTDIVFGGCCLYWPDFLNLNKYGWTYQNKTNALQPLVKGEGLMLLWCLEILHRYCLLSSDATWIGLSGCGVGTGACWERDQTYWMDSQWEKWTALSCSLFVLRLPLRFAFPMGPSCGYFTEADLEWGMLPRWIFATKTVYGLKSLTILAKSSTLDIFLTPNPSLVLCWTNWILNRVESR